MKFRIWTILWVFALLASAMATFGGWGILVACSVLGVSIAALDFRPLSNLAWFGIWTISFLLLILLAPVLGKLENTSLQNGCKANLESLAQAILNYETDHGSFPPPFSKDESGEILHSWRVLILPYLGQQTLYDSIRLGEPWDSEYNQRFWEQVPDVYRCPSCQKATEMGVIDCSPQAANYYAIIGENTIWSKDEKIRLKDVVGKFFSLGDLTTSDTVLLMEFCSQDGCWMQPLDLTARQAANVIRGQPYGHFSVEMKSGVSVAVSAKSTNIVYPDGRATTLSKKRVEETLRDFPNYPEYMLEHNGDRVFWSGVEIKQRQPLTEKDEPEALLPAQFTERTYLWRHLYSLLLFSFLSTLPLAKFARRN